MIVRILDEEKANRCDELLKKLIHDEKQYNPLINENFIVKDYFKNVIKDEKNFLLGYEINEKIVGYTYFKFINNDEGTGYLIDGLFVEEEYRNKGIAKTLISEGFKRINKNEIDFIDINVMSKNSIAFNLYKSFGFEILGYKMRKNNI